MSCSNMQEEENKDVEFEVQLKVSTYKIGYRKMELDDESDNESDDDSNDDGDDDSQDYHKRTIQLDDLYNEKMMDLTFFQSLNKTLELKDIYSQEVFEFRLKEIQAFEEFMHLQIAEAYCREIDVKILFQNLSSTYLKELTINELSSKNFSFISEIQKLSHLQILRIQFNHSQRYTKIKDETINFQLLQLKEISLQRVPECLKILKCFPNVIKAHLLFAEAIVFPENYFSSFPLLEKLFLTSLNPKILNPYAINLSQQISLKHLYFSSQNSLDWFCACEVPFPLEFLILENQIIKKKIKKSIKNDRSNKEESIDYICNEKMQFNFNSLKSLKMISNNNETEFISNLNNILQCQKNLEKLVIDITQINQPTQKLVNYLCSLLGSLQSIKMSLKLSFYRFELKQELEIALAIRRRKQLELFDLNDEDITDSIIYLGFAKGQKNIYSQLIIFGERVFKLIEEISSKVEMEKVTELLSPFIKVQMFSYQRYPQFQINKFTFLSKFQHNPILNFLSKDLIYLSFCNLTILDIEELSEECKNLISICDFHLILDKVPETTISRKPKRNLCLRFQIQNKKDLLRIIEMQGHVIDIIVPSDDNDKLSFEKEVRLFKKILKYEGRILIQFQTFDYSDDENEDDDNRKPNLTCIPLMNKYRKDVIQQILIAKVYTSLIANQLTINPKMVFSENWF